LPILGKIPFLKVCQSGIHPIGRWTYTQYHDFFRGMVLGEGKNSTDIILRSGSFIDEAMVARESA